MDLDKLDESECGFYLCEDDKKNNIKTELIIMRFNKGMTEQICSRTLKKFYFRKENKNGDFEEWKEISRKRFFYLYNKYGKETKNV